LQVSQTTSDAGEGVIRIAVRGTGTHRFLLRAENLTLANAPQEVVLRPGQRKEISGAAWKR
jgi:hypothetical protein